MKQILVILLCFVANTGFGQSGITEFSKTAGTIIEWEVLEKIENLVGCGIEVVRVKDVMSGESKTGVCFANSYRNGNNTYRVSAILDADEVNALIQAIPLLLKKTEERPKGEYKEVFFRSRSGLYCGCVKYGNAWVAVLKVDEHNPESYSYMHRHDLEMLLEFLTTAKTKI